MKTKLLLAIVAGTLVLGSCTENSRARRYGGTMTVDLPAGTKFLGAQWKGDELWYTYTMRKPSEAPSESTMMEDTRFGLIVGKIIFKEK